MRDKNAAKDTLRTKAEAKIAREPIALANPQPSEELLRKLLHELQVHEVELKMQNDELRQAQIAMEESRDRYVDLYDFAPIGYLTLSRQGLISEVNLTAADMLGIVRKQLVSRRFSQFVAQEDRERWDLHFVNVLQHSLRQRCEVSLLRGDGSRIHAQIDSVNCSELDKSSLPEVEPNWVTVVRIAISDISERTQAKTALHNAHGLTESIMEAAHEPLLVLDGELKVILASLSFYDHFRVTPEETVDRKLFELGQRQWDIPVLRNLLETILPQSRVLDNFVVEHDFPGIGRLKLSLNARYLTCKTNGTQAIMLAIDDITERI